MFKREADTWLSEMRGVLTSKTMTVAELGDFWLSRKRKQMERGNLAVSTYETYERALTNHLIPRLGHMKIADVKAFHIEQVLRLSDRFSDGIDWDLAAKVNGVKNYRSPGRASAQKWRAVLHNMFTLALRKEAVAVNPVALADNLTGSSREKKQRGLTLSEFTALLEKSKGTPGEAYIALAPATGARPSELLALQ